MFKRKLDRLMEEQHDSSSNSDIELLDRAYDEFDKRQSAKRVAKRGRKCRWSMIFVSICTVLVIAIVLPFMLQDNDDEKYYCYSNDLDTRRIESVYTYNLEYSNDLFYFSGYDNYKENAFLYFIDDKVVLVEQRVVLLYSYDYIDLRVSTNNYSFDFLDGYDNLGLSMMINDVDVSHSEVSLDRDGKYVAMAMFDYNGYRYRVRFALTDEVSWIDHLTKLLS